MKIASLASQQSHPHTGALLEAADEQVASSFLLYIVIIVV
jgi:hypothetical protein